MTLASPSPTLRANSVHLNKNTNWLDNPTFWVYYVLLVLVGWLIASALTDPGMAWTYVNIAHGVITYYLFHYKKGSPIEGDQGIWDSQTFWEQIDDGEQGTPARKFLLVVPVVIYILATNSTDFARQPLLVNLVVVAVLTIAKFSALHRVRIFGINKD